MPMPGKDMGEEEKNRRRRDNSADYFDSSIIGFFTFELDGFLVTDAEEHEDCDCLHPAAFIGTVCFDAHESTQTYDEKRKTESDSFRCTINANAAIDGESFRVISNNCEFTVARSGEGLLTAKISGSPSLTGKRPGDPVTIALRLVSENKVFMLATNGKLQVSGTALRNFRQFDPFNIRGGEKRLGEFSTGTMMGFHDDGTTAPSSADFTCPAVYPNAPSARDGDSDRQVGFDRFDASSARNELKHNAKGGSSSMSGPSGPGSSTSSSPAFAQDGCCEFGDNPFDSDHMM